MKKWIPNLIFLYIIFLFPLMWKTNRLIKLISLLLLFIGSSWLLFSTVAWDASIALLCLACLFYLLVNFIFKRTKKYVDHSSTVRSSVEIEKMVTALKNRKQSPEGVNPSSPPGKTETGNFDSTIFSEFQKKLHAKENEEQKKDRTEKLEKQEQEDDVVVKLSTTGIRKSKEPHTIPPAKTPPKPDVGSIENLFDDVTETLDSSHPEKKTTTDVPLKDTATTRPTSGENSREQTTAESQDQTQKIAQETLTPISPPISRETLSSKDFETSDEETEKENQIVLFSARRAFQSNNHEEALTAIKLWFEGTSNRPAKDYDWEMMLLKGLCEHGLGRFEAAVQSWQCLFNDYLTVEHPQFLSSLEQINDIFRKTNDQHFAIPFLVTTLNEYRKQNERSKMDEIYQEIEKGYEQLQDWPRLIQTYQNHLEIKKVLQDIPGQFEILDHLGKLMFDQGDAAGSKVCYEQSVQLKMKMG